MSINTEEFEEAKIVPDNEVQTPAPEIKSPLSDEDLLKKLSKVTAVKNPGNSQPESSKQKSFWERTDDDFEQEKTADPKAENKKETTGKTSEETAGKEGTAKITEKMKEGSANTAVGMFDFTAKLLFPPILNYKVKKKYEKSFTEKEQIALDERIIDEEKSRLDAAEMVVRNRFDRIMAKHQKKIDAVPLTGTEKKDLFDAFKNYFDYTETTLSPGWYLGMAIVNTMGKRAIDTFTE